MDEKDWLDGMDSCIDCGSSIEPGRQWCLILQFAENRSMAWLSCISCLEASARRHIRLMRELEPS